MSSAAIWKIEPGHSQIQFKVKHLAIANVNGIFKTFQGTVECQERGFDNATVNVSIAADSIDTQLSDRDKHLKSWYLFDADNYPLITFKGALERVEESYALNGDLTIRDVTRLVKLDAEFAGNSKGFSGDERAGFEASGKLNRRDFGLTWNISVDGGGLVIGDDIKLHFDIELVKASGPSGL